MQGINLQKNEIDARENKKEHISDFSFKTKLFPVPFLMETGRVSQFPLRLYSVREDIRRKLSTKVKKNGTTNAGIKHRKSAKLP